MKKRVKKRVKRDNLSLMILLIITIIIILLIYFVILFIYVDYRNINSIDPTKNLVVDVIDGDTFILSNNQHVRLICIDCPEKADSGYIESKEFLEDLILNKEVRLEKDINDKDTYGRLLRYAYINDSSGNEIFINSEIVRNGHGEVFRYGDDVSRCDEIERM